MSSYLNIVDPSAPCTEFEGTKLSKEYSFPLDPFQKYALCAIEKGENVLVTAKTGSGKTLVGEHLIARMLALGKRVFYTTPIKSLSNQKFHDLKQLYPSVGILTGDIKYRPDAQIVIMTTEILRNLLYKENTSTRSLGTSGLVSLDGLGGVVFDECHYINDHERGKVWEESFILLDPSIQLVLLSATIDRPEVFAQWLGELKQVPIHLISTQYRIVPLLHHVLIGTQPQLLMDNKEVFNQETYMRWLQWREQKRRDQRTHQTAVGVRRAGGYEDPVIKGPGGLPSYIHQLNETVDMLQKRSLLPALFFVFSRKDCEMYASKISANLIDSSDAASVRHIWNFHLHKYKELETLPQAHTLLGLLEKGIAFHHSGLLPVLREIVEILFGKGLIKLLFATETFAVGINMPTKTVVFTDVEKFSNESGLRKLRTDEYIQMAGRAGRRGKDTEGYVFYLPKSDPVSSIEMKEMMTGRRTPIMSRMDFHYEFLLKTIHNKNLQWLHLMNNSYWFKQREQELLSTQKEIEGVLQTQLALGLTKEQIVDLRVRDDLEAQLKTATNAARKKAQKQLDQWKDSHEGVQWETAWKLYSAWKRYDETLAQLQEDRDSLQDSTSSIRNKITFLREIGYLKDDTTISHLGTLATEINEGHSLLLSHAYNEQVHKDFTREDLVCFLAAFLGEGLKEDETSVDISRLPISEALKTALYDVDDYANELITIEKRLNCRSPPKYWELNGSWIEIARRWYTGEDIAVLCSDYGIYEGNFIRSMLKLGNLIEEWTCMMTYCEHTEYLHKFEGLREDIVRDIARPQSLYLLL